MDVVLATMEVLELITHHREEFDSIKVEGDEKVCWEVDKMVQKSLETAGKHLSKQEILGDFKVFSVKDHPLYTSSEVSSTSNNYLNQILIKTVRDSCGKVVQEGSIKEQLRRNKKGFGVGGF